jgi:hypothetical protein
MSNATEYIPKPGSLTEKVISYFRNNPGKTLSIDEIREIWSVKYNVVLELERALTHGWLVRAVHDLDIFMPGHKLKASMPADPSVISQPKPRKGPGRGHSKLTHFDIDAVQVDKDVPIPAGTVRKKHESKWAPLLAKLTTKGDSVALPDHYRGTIDSYIRKLTKARPDKAPQFRTGRDDSGVTRIWRVA